MTKWTLVSDDAGHEYVIPYDKRNDWYEWLEDETNWDQPEYSYRIDGGNLIFERPCIDGKYENTDIEVYLKCY